MARVYADLIRKGIRSINDVPANLKEQVTQILMEMGFPELADSE